MREQPAPEDFLSIIKKMEGAYNCRFSREPSEVLALKAFVHNETDVYPQPKISPELAADRERINKMCFNNAEVAPESLIRRAIEPPVDFIDLYAYYNQALNHRAEEFHKANPHAKVVHVGLEFGSSRQDMGFKDSEGITHFNKFLINYDALSFLMRLEPESTGFINLDTPDLKDRKTIILEQAFRVLKKGGLVSFYITQGTEEEIFSQLKSLGFSQFETRDPEEHDFLKRRPRDSQQAQIIRVLATK